MLKNFQREKQMSSADLAIDYARRLINEEARGPGDIEDAMRRLETKTGLGYWTLWGLWNRRRKVVDRDLFNRVRGAYLAVCEKQLARLRHDLAIEQVRCADDDFKDLVVEAEVLAAKLKAARTGKVAHKSSPSPEDNGGD